ncbi:hypothetical protein [Streptomyces brasiliensis]|uniref:Uncharacterized protein n=1 Tax=Streptomyces brasiliensis TaxID=1954 RepID=A0A917KH29_9ACTN|nr:hypothetical protein [Streptomyces brasiliensis]GGJ13849.1 hypothetical protein GCM10010121_025550 [Streptomyces brasiliensis]
MNQSPIGNDHALTGAGARLSNCSDLLDDFLDKIRNVETEYLRAARERHGGAGAVPAKPPGSRALDGTS